MRTPISSLRCVTTNDITPYKPITASSNANVPKATESDASRRSVRSVDREASDG
jgi:hypothetical protein